MDDASISTRPDRPSRSRVLKSNRKTPAAQWNARLLRALDQTLKKDPEADIAALLPPDYPQQLLSLKKPRHPAFARTFPVKDIRSRLSTIDDVTVVFELQPEVTSLLQNKGSLSAAIVGLLAEAEVLHEGLCPASVMVFRVGKSIVVKITDEDSVVTEHASLSYLKQHLPDFPAPKPLGAVRFGIFCLLFSTFIPGLDLERAWPGLEATQKRSISAQLDTLFSDLRSLPFTENMPLGGVNGDGCKDARRAVRVSSEPIWDAAEFEYFIFSGSQRASAVYTQFLRTFIPANDAMKIVFTHADLRLANIRVEMDEAGSWKVVGVIDWERSGFYPEYWESVKATNNLTPMELSDWYNYLPYCISPNRYPRYWLLDRVRDRSMDNS